MQDSIHVARAIDGRNETDTLLFSIVNQVRHLSLRQVIAIWIIVISIGSFFNGFLDILAGISLITNSQGHIIQLEA